MRDENRKAMWAKGYNRLKNITNAQYRKHITPFADADKDGVRNIDDCRPFDKKKQDVDVVLEKLIHDPTLLPKLITPSGQPRSEITTDTKVFTVKGTDLPETAIKEIKEKFPELKEVKELKIPLEHLRMRLVSARDPKLSKKVFGGEWKSKWRDAP